MNWITTYFFLLSFSIFGQGEKYEASRIGYFHGYLEINSDSTYVYQAWNHRGQTVKDKGELIVNEGKLCLNSTGKTRRKSKRGKSNKFYYFEMREIIRFDDRIIILPCDELFPEYCTYWKK